MLDTGASFSCLNPRYASHLPMSGKYIKTVGFSGVTQLLPMTAPVSISLKDTEIRIPILVSEHTPVNLLGRDAICKLKMQIWCTPDRIYVDDRAFRQMNVSTLQQTQEPCANIYWLGELKEEVERTISKWGRYIREQLCEPSLPKTDFNCTMKYDENKDPELEKRWLANTKGLKMSMMSQYIVVGPEGAALQVDREKFIDEWFEVPNSVPHVTLYVNKNCASKDLGPMMQKAEEVIRKIKRQGYWSPYLQAMVDEYLSECDVCAQNNVRKGVSAPIGHIPVPEGPFKHLVMDYADMIRTVRGKRYL